jgi:hypothetical protein
LKRDAFQPSLRAQAKQSRAAHAEGLDCFVASAPRNDEEAGDFVKQPCVYIMANRRNGTLYTGVTSNPLKRAFEHREGLVKG